jgi:hypothetical protein
MHFRVEMRGQALKGEIAEKRATLKAQQCHL